ncbi:hypothetical protein E1176_12185 [Fulvivirga sp. RKSG066]|nr:hypothetical protein [Fulvivirga aurantia]
MLRFLLTAILWCILLVLCWPLAILIGFIWLILLPFQILGFGVSVIFKLVTAIIKLPFEVARAVTR